MTRRVRGLAADVNRLRVIVHLQEWISYCLAKREVSIMMTNTNYDVVLTEVRGNTRNQPGKSCFQSNFWIRLSV